MRRRDSPSSRAPRATQTFVSLTGPAGNIGDALPGIGALALAGAAMIANGALRLPGWARLRGRQMESLAAKVALPGETKPND